MSTHKYKLTVENLFSGEFASFDITDSGVKYCLENPEEFAGPWTYEDLSEQAQTIFKDAEPPEQWVDNIEDIYALAEGFTIRIENISDTEQTLLTIELSQEDLTLTEIEDSGFRDQRKNEDDGAQGMLYMFDAGEGYAVFELEIEEELDPSKLSYTAETSAFGNLLQEIHYLSKDNNTIVANNVEFEFGAADDRFEVATGWTYKSNHSYDWTDSEKETQLINQENPKIKDKEIVLAAVQNDGDALDDAAEELQADKEIVLAAVQQNGFALVYAAEELQADKEIVLAAVKNEGEALDYAAEELQADKEIVLAAVKQHGEALTCAAEELQADKEIVLAAVKQHGEALVYAAEELKADKEIVLAAVQQDGSALVFAAEELQADKEIVLAAEQNN